MSAKTERVYSQTDKEGFLIFSGTIDHYENCFGGCGGDASFIESDAERDGYLYSEKDVTAEYVLSHPDEFPREWLDVGFYPTIKDDLLRLLATEKAVSELFEKPKV